MDTISNTLFYFLAALVFISSVVILVSKEAKTYVVAAIVTFLSIAGFFVLIKSPLMFIIQILFFTLGLGALLIYLSTDVEPIKKRDFSFNYKTFLTPVVLGVFALLFFPFINSQAQSYQINTYSTDIIGKIVSTLNVNLIVITMIVLVVLSGFYSIVQWRRK